MIPHSPTFSRAESPSVSTTNAPGFHNDGNKINTNNISNTTNNNNNNNNTNSNNKVNNNNSHSNNNDSNSRHSNNRRAGNIGFNPIWQIRAESGTISIDAYYQWQPRLQTIRFEKNRKTNETSFFGYDPKRPNYVQRLRFINNNNNNNNVNRNNNSTDNTKPFFVQNIIYKSK